MSDDVSQRLAELQKALDDACFAADEAVKRFLAEANKLKDWTEVNISGVSPATFRKPSGHPSVSVDAQALTNFNDVAKLIVKAHEAYIAFETYYNNTMPASMRAEPFNVKLPPFKAATAQRTLFA